MLYTILNMNTESGASIHTEIVARKLMGLGHDIILMAPARSAATPFKIFPFKTLYLGIFSSGSIFNKLIEDVDGVVKLIRLIKSGWRPEAVYVRFGFSTIFFPIACKILRLPYITEINGSYEQQLLTRRIPKVFVAFLRSIELLNYICSDRIVAVSDEIARVVGAMKPIKMANITVVTNGVDIPELSTSVAKNSELEYRIRGNSAKLVFGFVGIFEKWHGISNLVQAVSILKNNHPKIASEMRVVLIGDGTERTALEKEIIVRDVDDVVKLLGWVDHKDLFDYLALVDVAVAPYLAVNPLGCSLKILEYMAAGKWVITTEMPVVSDIIRKLDAGMNLKSNDPQALADAMSHAWDNRREFWKKADVTKSYIKDNYSWDVIIRQIELVIISATKDSIKS